MIYRKLLPILCLFPVLANADLEREGMAPVITEYKKPLFCELYDKDGKFISSIILTWGMLHKIDEGNQELVFVKDGKPVRIGPKTSYVCTKLLGG